MNDDSTTTRRRGRVHTFADIREDFDAIVGSINYATMVTVDAQGRPRTRVLIPVWETEGDDPLGWLVTYPTPVKVAHLAHNPNVGFSYWNRTQNTVSVDGTASWSEDPGERRRVWDLYRYGSPPGAGYDPGAFWTGPDDPEMALLRIEPRRVQVLRGRDLVTGVPARIWTREPRR